METKLHKVPKYFRNFFQNCCPLLLRWGRIFIVSTCFLSNFFIFIRMHKKKRLRLANITLVNLSLSIISHIFNYTFLKTRIFFYNYISVLESLSITNFQPLLTTYFSALLVILRFAFLLQLFLHFVFRFVVFHTQHSVPIP